MERARRALVGTALGIAATAVVLWALSEARRQRNDTADVLVAEASLVAQSLGPALAAQSTAARELDELVTWKLLDNARLLAELWSNTELREDALNRLALENGLDQVAILTDDGTLALGVGEPLDDSLLAALDDLLDGLVDETLVGSASGASDQPVAAAVRAPGGGVVVTSAAASEAHAFGRRVGVANLLDSLVDSGVPLYLSYREDPLGIVLSSSWDGGPVPPPPLGEAGLHSVRGRRIFEIEVPVESPAGTVAALRVGLDGARLEEASAAGLRRALLVALVILGIAFSLSAWAVVSRARTVDREEASRALAKAETARRRSERLAAAGALAAGLAHEVRSPLNAIGLAAQRLERKHADGEECALFARRIRDEVTRLENTLSRFLELAQPVSEDREATDLRAVAQGVRTLLEDEAAAAAVVLAPVEGQARTRVDPEAIRRALVNLIRNAIQASPPASTVRTVIGENDHEVLITIADQGAGPDPELGDRVFEAFVSKRSGGTGLGLSLVRRVAEEHGGRAFLVAAPGRGAEAGLRLPRTDPRDERKGTP